MSEDWDGIAVRLAYANENQMWADLYVTKEWSTAHIADLLGFSRATIRCRLKKHNIKLRSRGGVHRYAQSLLRLLRMDTRQAIHGSLSEAARLANLSVTTVWQFRRWAQGGTQYENRSNITDIGSGEVVSDGNAASSASADR